MDNQSRDKEGVVLSRKVCFYGNFKAVVNFSSYTQLINSSELYSLVPLFGLPINASGGNIE